MLGCHTGCEGEEGTPATPHYISAARFSPAGRCRSTLPSRVEAGSGVQETESQRQGSFAGWSSECFYKEMHPLLKDGGEPMRTHLAGEDAGQHAVQQNVIVVKLQFDQFYKY